MGTTTSNLLLGAVLLCAMQGCGAAPLRDDGLIDVHPESHAEIRITKEKVRSLPVRFFGLNQEAQIFEAESVDERSGQLKPDILKQLQALPELTYRYPGGLMANHFNWEWTVGAPATRAPQKMAGWSAPSAARFGLDEYLSFLDKVNGHFWYTLNLNGWSATSMAAEQPSAMLAASNKKLAARIHESGVPAPHYYQLGNELDRSEYEWTTEKYIQRAKETIEAVSAVDPDARFVAFLRDFNLKYKKSTGGSPYKPFNKAVLDALPMVNDISFQYYYDDARNENIRSSIPWRLKMFQAAIRDATEARNGRTPNVWVTEHGRSRNPDVKGRFANTFTSGLAGAISAADFWIATAQMPAIQGAFLYSVGQWNIFSNKGDGTDAMPMYWTLRLLSNNRLPNVLTTWTGSPNFSAYIGGYDVRGVAFSDDTYSKLGVWVVNRASRTQPVTVTLPVFRGKKVSVRHDFMAGQSAIPADQNSQAPSVNLNQAAQSMTVGNDGVLVLELPASSVSSFHISLGN